MCDLINESLLPHDEVRDRLDKLDTTIMTMTERQESQHLALGAKIDSLTELVHTYNVQVAVHNATEGHGRTMVRLDQHETELNALQRQFETHSLIWRTVGKGAGLVAGLLALVLAYLQVVGQGVKLP